VTYQVVGHAKTCIILLVAFFRFPSANTHEQNVKLLGGIAIAMVSVVLYGHLKLKNKERATAAAAAAASATSNGGTGGGDVDGDSDGDGGVTDVCDVCLPFCCLRMLLPGGSNNNNNNNGGGGGGGGGGSAYSDAADRQLDDAAGENDDVDDIDAETGGLLAGGNGDGNRSRGRVTPAVELSKLQSTPSAAAATSSSAAGVHVDSLLVDIDTGDDDGVV
jgi:hypothetical protein